MKNTSLIFYGTAGAQGLPALFCNCDTCRKARAAGNRNLMTRSQAMITEEGLPDLLIDMPPDTYMHTLVHGLDLVNINHLLITHAHGDHLNIEALSTRTSYLIAPNDEHLHIYGSDVTGQHVAEMIASDKKDRYDFTELEAYTEHDIAGWKVTPLLANHDKHLHSMNFIVESPSHAVLYATDTQYPEDDYFKGIENYSGKPFDIVALDCAWTGDERNYSHMNITDCVKYVKRLNDLAKTTPQTRFILTHFAHFGLIYDELITACTKVFADTGVLLEPAYDGMVVTA